MCAMSGTAPPKSMPTPRVGVRELRQNLSVYLDRVKEGERLEVTEHGRPVALLVPLPPEEDQIARLVAEGKMRPAKGSLREWLAQNPPLEWKPASGKTLTQILLEMRDEEDF